MTKNPFDPAIDKGVEALDKAKDMAVHAHETQSARAWVGVAALIASVVASVAAVFLMRDFGQRNFEYMPDMAYSKAWEAQTEHDYAHDYDKYTDELPPWMVKHGSPDMPPPAGTRYRGQRTYEFTTEDLQSPEVINMPNPFASATGAERAELLKRGKNLFKFNCQGCHGVDGVGQAPVTFYGISAPTIANATTRDKWTDGQIFNIISDGRNTMPAHATHVEFQDRWKVILYLRQLQEGK